MGVLVQLSCHLQHVPTPGTTHPGQDPVECPIRSNVSIADTDCEGGCCETEFRRGSDLPASLRCIKNDPTQEKVTWSPYALINKERGIWCQWPAFGLADVRCVCQGEDRCNNLPKPGRSNRQRNSSTPTSGQPSPLTLPILLPTLLLIANYRN